MRAEVRVELDEHEYAVTVECDQSASKELMLRIAADGVRDLLAPPMHVSKPLR